MSCERLKTLLNAEDIKYVSIHHSPAYTAQTVAESAHVSGRVLAKPVIVDLDGEMAMAVVPANRRLIVEDLREVTGCERVKLVGENAFKSKFPDCETGAMPPFGNLYGMDTYLAAELGQNHDIAFNGGSHREVIVMAYKDYERIAKPKVLETIA
jgi:Ala-tRNA(Pro) deacylase